MVYGNRNWVPATIYGTTPAWLGVREWALAEGDMFTDAMYAMPARYASWARDSVRKLFQGESPSARRFGSKTSPFKVIGVLAAKGANMMGMDQDDILLAPWTTDQEFG